MDGEHAEEIPITCRQHVCHEKPLKFKLKLLCLRYWDQLIIFSSNPRFSLIENSWQFLNTDHFSSFDLQRRSLTSPNVPPSVVHLPHVIYQIIPAWLSICSKFMSHLWSAVVYSVQSFKKGSKSEIKIGYGVHIPHFSIKKSSEINKYSSVVSAENFVYYVLDSFYRGCRLCNLLW